MKISPLLKKSFMILLMILYAVYLNAYIPFDLSATAVNVTFGIVDANNTPPTASNVSFSGTLTEGETLTGTYDYSDTENDPESGSTYKWYRSDDNSGTSKTFITGATSLTYVLTANDIDKHISFEVTPTNGNGTGLPVESNLQGKVKAENCSLTLPEGGFAGGFQTGQSFVASCSGTLRSVGLIVVLPSTGHSFSIYEGDGTTGNVLGTVSSVDLTSSALHLGDDFRYIDFSSENINLTEGQTYTFINSANTDPTKPPTLNQSGNTNPYTDGTLYIWFSGSANASPIGAQDLNIQVNTGPFINTVPSFTKGSDQTINEDAGTQTVTGWATNISNGEIADGRTQAINFNVTNDNNELFIEQPSIDAGGTLTYKSAPDAHGSATVTVTLSDDGGTENGGVDTSEQQTFTINVNSVNDPPFFYLVTPSLSVQEDAGPQTITSWVFNMTKGADNESGQVLSLSVSNNNEDLFSVQPAIDASGNLTFTTAENANGDASVTVILMDDGGTANGGDNDFQLTFGISVQLVNDPPVFTKGADQTINEDDGMQTIAGWATNMSPGPEDEAGQALTFIVSNDNNELFASQPTVDAISGNLTFTPADNAFGTANVSIYLKDNSSNINGSDNSSEAQDFTITVNPVNDAPVLTETVFDFENASGFATPTITQTVNGTQIDVTAEGGLMFVGNFGVSDGIESAVTFNVVPGTAENDIVVTFSEAVDLESLKAAEINNYEYSWTFTPSDGSGNNPVTDFINPATAQTVNLNWRGITSFTINADNGEVDPKPSYLLDDFIFITTSDKNLTSIGEDESNSSGDLVSRLEGISLEIDEGDPFGIAVTNSDNTFGTWQYSIDEGSNWSDFGTLTETSALLLSGENKIRFVPNTDFNGTVTDGLTIRVWDQSAGTIGGTADVSTNGSSTPYSWNDLSLNITIDPVNDEPSFSKGEDQAINEDAGAQTISWVTSIDPGADNETDQTLSFNVSNNNNDLFSVQPAVDSDGILTYTPSENASGLVTVTINIMDDGGTDNGGDDTSDEQTFTITVTAVNDVPSFTKGNDQTVLEDAGEKTVSGWATDLSAGPSNENEQILSFNVSNDNNDLFSVQPAINASGNLSYTPADNAIGSATVTVSISDDGGTDHGGINTSGDQTFTITVTSVNDAPTFTKGADQSVNEDTGNQTVSNWATDLASGPSDENGQSLNFNISNDNNELFSVQPALDASGNLTYTPADNTNGIATVTVSLTDDGGTDDGGMDTSEDQTFTITVNAVNDIPSFTKGADETILEDSGPITITEWATNISKGPDNENSQILSFNVSNDNNDLFEVQPAIDESGNLIYTPANDAVGIANVIVSLSDDGGTENGGVDTSTEETFIITINPVNDAPSLTVGSNQTVNEDAGTQIISSWATNINKGPQDEDDQTLTIEVSNNNNNLFAVQPEIDITTGNLTYTPADDIHGIATITFSISDDGGTENGGIDISEDYTFTITLNAVNDAPSFVKGEDQTVNEDVGEQMVSWVTSVDLGADNETGQNYSFNVTSNNNDLFNIQPAIDTDGFLSYTPKENANGSATVTVNIMDDGGTENGGIDTSEDQTFIITINAVNDAPSFTKGNNQTVLEDAGEQFITDWATDLNKGASNESNQSLSFLVSNDNNSLFSVQPIIDTNGNLIYTPASDENGLATLTVSLSDDGGTQNGGIDTSDSQTFTISITAVNDAPSFIKGADEAVFEDSGEHIINGWASDITFGPSNESEQNLNFVLENDNNILFSVQPNVDANGNLSYSLADDAFGSAVVSVRLKDDGGTENGGVDTSDEQTFVITVSPVNDAPSFTIGSDQTVLEDAEAQTILSWATDLTTGAIYEENETLSFNVSNDNNSLFSVQPTIDGITGDLSYTPAENANGVANITVSISDDGGTDNGGTDTSEEQTFTITIESVNDIPNFNSMELIEVNEDAGQQTILNWATEISAGAPDEENQSLVFNVLSNSNNDLFDVLPFIDPLTGNLTFTSKINANGTADLTINLTDNGGTVNGGDDTSESINLTISITPVNDQPTFTIGVDQAADEDAGEQIISAWVTSVIVGPNDESNQNFEFNITNDNNSLFAVQPTIDQNGTLSYTPAVNAFGIANVTVSVTDNGGTTNGGIDTSSEQTFTITVNAVNDAPAFTSTPANMATEDELYSYSITTEDHDPDASLEILNSSMPDWLNFTDHGDGTATLSGTPVNGDVGTHDIVLEVSDGITAENTKQAFQIEVANTNDAPEISSNIPTEISFCPQEEEVEIDLSEFASDIDVGDVLSYAIASTPITGIEVDLTGSVLKVAHTAKISGTFDIDIQVSDQGALTANVTIKVNVNYFDIQVKNDGNLLRIISDGEFQWFKDGNAISGATSNSYRASEVGSYMVTVTNGNCLITSETFEIDAATSIEINDISNEITVYPNPSRAYIYIESELALLEKAEIMIYDIHGKLVKNEKLRTDKIDISSLQNGVYIMQIFNGRNNKAVKRIVKQ